MLLQLLPSSEIVNVLAWLYNGSKYPKGALIISKSTQHQWQVEFDTACNRDNCTIFIRFYWTTIIRFKQFGLFVWVAQILFPLGHGVLKKQDA